MKSVQQKNYSKNKYKKRAPPLYILTQTNRRRSVLRFSWMCTGLYASTLDRMQGASNSMHSMACSLAPPNNVRVPIDQLSLSGS